MARLHNASRGSEAFAEYQQRAAESYFSRKFNDFLLFRLIICPGPYVRREVSAVEAFDSSARTNFSRRETSRAIRSKIERERKTKKVFICGYNSCEQLVHYSPGYEVNYLITVLFPQQQFQRKAEPQTDDFTSPKHVDVNRTVRFSGVLFFSPAILANRGV